MSSSERRSRAIAAGLSLAGTSGVAAWSLAQSSAQLAAPVALAGVGGVVTLAASLAGRRKRPLLMSVVLVGVAVVAGTLRESAGARASVLAIAGGVLFCSAEMADLSLAFARHVEYRRGVRRFNPAGIVGVAVASGAASYGAASTRGLVAGGGPAALACGTVAAVLVVILARTLLRGRVT